MAAGLGPPSCACRPAACSLSLPTHRQLGLAQGRERSQAFLGMWLCSAWWPCLGGLGHPDCARPGHPGCVRSVWTCSELRRGPCALQELCCVGLGVSGLTMAPVGPVGLSTLSGRVPALTGVCAPGTECMGSCRAAMAGRPGPVSRGGRGAPTGGAAESGQPSRQVGEGWAGLLLPAVPTLSSPPAPRFR